MYAKSKNKSKKQPKSRSKLTQKMPTNSKQQLGNRNKYDNHITEPAQNYNIPRKIDQRKYNGPQKQKQQISSKQLRTQLDEIESLLKNRDLSPEQLKAILTKKVFDKLLYAYYQYESFKQQVARIVLQIYSHHPVRHLLYVSNYKQISFILMPLLLKFYKSVNQFAALQCLQGVIEQGKLNLLEVLKQPEGKTLMCENSSFELTISRNIEYIIKQWSGNCKSIFVCGLLQLIYRHLKTNFENNNNLEVKSKKINYALSDSELVLRYLTCQLSKKITRIDTGTKITIKEGKIIIQIFKLYINYVSSNLTLPPVTQTTTLSKLDANAPKCEKDKNVSQGQQKQHQLLFKWALYSVIDKQYHFDAKSKKKRIDNTGKEIFSQVMEYIEMLINKNKIEKKQSSKEQAARISQNLRKYQQEQKQDHVMNQNKNKDQNRHDTANNVNINHIINFLYSMLYPFSQNQLSNEYKLIVLMKYSDIFLYLLNSVNIEDNLSENYMQTIIECIFNMAIFCDQSKKKHKLQALLEEIRQMGLIPSSFIEFLRFDDCESVLYRVLISIEKCLPRYPLRYYQAQYIERPGIFHLYFITQILNQRKASETTKFLVNLIQRWIKIQMRDFNVLGYTCKFMTHFLSQQSEGGSQKGLKTIFKFFRSLSEEAFVYLNIIFYQSSFSEIPSPYFTNGQNIRQQNTRNSINLSQHEKSNASSVGFMSNNEQLGQFSPPCFSFTLPPLTLCSFQQQSLINSCGYSYSDKSLFIDKNFSIGQELLRWSTLLHEINDDQFYFNCKYFYFLLTSSYNRKDYNNKKARTSRLFDDQVTNFKEQSKNLSKKIDRILEIWQESIIKNRTNVIHSIFQILLCWSTYTLSISNKNKQNYNQIVNNEQLKKIVSILLENSQKLICLKTIFAQNWRQALKQMQTNSQLLDNYKKEQIKFRNKHLYFLRSISMFFQSIAIRMCFLAPKHKTFQHIIQIIQSYSSYAGGFSCWRSYRLLSEKMSRNLFLQKSVIILNQSKNIGDLIVGQSNITRKKLEIYRQIIFAFIQQDIYIAKDEAYPQSISKNTQNSKFSQSSQKSRTKNIEQMSQFQLKTKIDDIVVFCIEVICAPIVDNSKKAENNTNLNILKNEKQELYNKSLAFQILQEFFNRCLVNKACYNILLSISSIKLIFQNNNQFILQSLRRSIIKVLFRDSQLITKYQRRLILHLRYICLNWVASNKSIQLHNFFNETKIHSKKRLESKNKNNQEIKCLLNTFQIFLTIWHLVMDEQIQLRIQIISILTNNFKYDNFSIIQTELCYVCAILTLIVTLQPKTRVKLYVQKMVNIIYTKFIQSNMLGYDFLMKIMIIIGSFICNSKVSIPSIDIFQNFCNLWLRVNKDSYYILLCAIQQLENQNYKFRNVQILPNQVNIGEDLKNYYVNLKSKKGWIHAREKGNFLQRSQIVIKNIKIAFSQKNKHAKFLKSKKQVLFSIGQFIQEPQISQVIQKMSSIQIKNRQDKQYSSQHLIFKQKQTSDQATQNQNQILEDFGDLMIL